MSRSSLAVHGDSSSRTAGTDFAAVRGLVEDVVTAAFFAVVVVGCVRAAGLRPAALAGVVLAVRAVVAAGVALAGVPFLAGAALAAGAALVVGAAFAGASFAGVAFFVAGAAFLAGALLAAFAAGAAFFVAVFLEGAFAAGDPLGAAVLVEEPFVLEPLFVADVADDWPRTALRAVATALAPTCFAADSAALTMRTHFPGCARSPFGPTGGPKDTACTCTSQRRNAG